MIRTILLCGLLALGLNSCASFCYSASMCRSDRSGDMSTSQARALAQEVGKL